MGVLVPFGIGPFWVGPFWVGPFWHGPFWVGPFWSNFWSLLAWSLMAGPFWPVPFGLVPFDPQSIFGEVSDRQVGYKNQIWDLMHHVTTPIFDCTLRKFINGLLNIWKLVRITEILDPQSIYISVREVFLN